MKLDDLCETFEFLPFPIFGEQAHPERPTILSARAQIAAAVADDEFLIDCISRELQRIADGRLGWGLPPFFLIPHLGIRFAFGYWPPGATAGPHEHTAWTITAVCRNQLEVLTYNREESYRQGVLVPKNKFAASAGRTGFIYDPCIHEPRNPSGEWSLSLHVTSPRDGERVLNHQGCPPCLRPRTNPAVADDLYMRVAAVRHRYRFVLQLARILIAMDSPQASRVLAQCAELATSATRRMIDRSAPKPGYRDVPGSRWLLMRRHEELVLGTRCKGDLVSLIVKTRHGPWEALTMAEVAKDMFAVVARHSIFDVYALPGQFSEDERVAIGDALEETGLFTRI